MSHPPHIQDANFNEVYGTMYHDEDRRQTQYHDSRDHCHNMSAGDVNIKFASGNVNTGMVYGTLQQLEGKTRSPKRRPQRHTLPASFPHRISPRPPISSPVPQRQGVPYHEFERGPVYDEPQPSRSHRSREQGPQPAPPRSYNYPRPPPSHMRERHGRDDLQHLDDEQGYHGVDNETPRQHAAKPFHPQGGLQNEVYCDDHNSHRRPQAPAMKSKNPFRNLLADATPASQYSRATRPPVQQRAATTDYTSTWVANTSTYSYTYGSPTEELLEEPEDDETSAIGLSLRSPSEDSASSSSSSSQVPGFWSRAASRSSGATSQSRCSPVPEERFNSLFVRKPRSRSSTPGLC